MIGRRLPEEVRRLELPRGERPLAFAVTDAGMPVVGTRTALHLGRHRIPWEQVHSADWEPETEQLRISEIGEFARQRPVHALSLGEPERLLDLVRERVTSTMVLQRHVPIHADRGLFVIARRSPAGETTWYFDFQEGTDPSDPEVRRLAHEAMARIRADLGP